MKKLLLILFLLTVNCLLLTINCVAQPSMTWQRSYDNGFNSNNEGADICKSSLGTYFIVGNSNFHPQVIKINDMGDSLWSRFYPTVNFLPTRCVSSGNGSCVMVGERGSNSRVKLDANGNIIWNIPNDTFPSELYGLIKTADNNFVACGSAGTPIIGYIMKFDSLGGLVWARSYKTLNQMRFYSITEAYNRGYLVCGTEDDGNFSARGIVIRIDDSGNEVWRRYPLPTTYNRSSRTIRKFGSKYLIVGGEGDSVAVSKIDTSGNLLYNKIFLAPEGSFYFSSHDENGEVYNTNEVILYWNHTSQTNGFTTISRLDSNFNQLSFSRIDYPHGFSYLTGCLPLTNGDILFAGFIELENWYNNNFYAIRTDSTLNSPLIAIRQISSEIPVHSKLLRNYPNPFNPSTKIKFEVNKKSFVNIRIYNSLGKEIQILTSKFFEAGVYELEWEASRYASGVYFCVLNVDNKIANTLKLIFTK